MKFWSQIEDLNIDYWIQFSFGVKLEDGIIFTYPCNNQCELRSVYVRGSRWWHSWRFRDATNWQQTFIAFFSIWFVTELRKSGVMGYEASPSVPHVSLSWGWRRDRHTPRTGGQAPTLNHSLDLSDCIMVNLYFLLRQTSDPGFGERWHRAECGTASPALSDQPAESRKGSDYRWDLSAGNVPGQLHWGSEGGSGQQCCTATCMFAQGIKEKCWLTVLYKLSYFLLILEQVHHLLLCLFADFV